MHKWSLAIGLSLCAAVQAAPPGRVEIAYEVLYNDGVIADVTRRFDAPPLYARVEMLDDGGTQVTVVAEQSSTALVL